MGRGGGHECKQVLLIGELFRHAIRLCVSGQQAERKKTSIERLSRHDIRPFNTTKYLQINARKSVVSQFEKGADRESSPLLVRRGG